MKAITVETMKPGTARLFARAPPGAAEDGVT